jgi:DNA polymerase III epsilon subunit-like protein
MIFEDYFIESQNNNMIGFEINLEHLHRALKSAQTAEDISIKLTKKNGHPMLSFGIDILRVCACCLCLWSVNKRLPTPSL